MDSSTVRLSASYKGISAGFSLNPAKWFNKTKDYEYNINIYTNRIGIDFTHGKRTSMKGHIASERINRIDHSGIRLKNTSINAYYNFNNKKFSYPAIFSHSWIYRFLSNHLRYEALTIAELYRECWNVELFFKWVKQHLHIKSFYGTSGNAVYTQI